MEYFEKLECCVNIPNSSPLNDLGSTNNGPVLPADLTLSSEQLAEANRRPSSPPAEIVAAVDNRGFSRENADSTSLSVHIRGQAPQFKQQDTKLVQRDGPVLTPQVMTLKNESNASRGSPASIDSDGSSSTNAGVNTSARDSSRLESNNTVSFAAKTVKQNAVSQFQYLTYEPANRRADLNGHEAVGDNRARIADVSFGSKRASNSKVQAARMDSSAIGSMSQNRKGDNIESAQHFYNPNTNGNTVHMG